MRIEVDLCSIVRQFWLRAPELNAFCQPTIFKASGNCLSELKSCSDLVYFVDDATAKKALLTQGKIL